MKLAESARIRAEKGRKLLNSKKLVAINKVTILELN